MDAEARTGFQMEPDLKLEVRKAPAWIKCSGIPILRRLIEEDHEVPGYLGMHSKSEANVGRQTQ